MIYWGHEGGSHITKPAIDTVANILAAIVLILQFSYTQHSFIFPVPQLTVRSVPKCKQISTVSDNETVTVAAGDLRAPQRLSLATRHRGERRARGCEGYGSRQSKSPPFPHPQLT